MAVGLVLSLPTFFSRRRNIISSCAAVSQNGSYYRQAIQYVVYRLPAGDTVRSVSPAGNHCHVVLLDKDESCPKADLSNINCPNGPAYSTGKLLDMPKI